MTLSEILLCALIAVAIVVLIVLTVYFVKFLKELTMTLTSIRSLTDMAQNEIRPSLQSLNQVLATAHKITNSANNHITTVRNVVTALFGAYCLSLTNMKNQSEGFVRGLVSGFNIFRKKRR